MRLSGGLQRRLDEAAEMPVAAAEQGRVDHQAAEVVADLQFLGDPDAAVHLEAPKLGHLKREMAAKLADTLKLPRHFVNVKAKTGEGLDAVGELNAVEAIAIAQVEATRSHTQILPKIE